MDVNETQQRSEKCTASGCKNSSNSEQMGAFFLFLARNIFGPFGGQLTEGYCTFCKKRNLSRAFLFLIVVFSLIVAVIELPWKGPLFEAAMIMVWTALLRKWAFGARE